MLHGEYLAGIAYGLIGDTRRSSAECAIIFITLFAKNRSHDLRVWPGLLQVNPLLFSWVTFFDVMFVLYFFKLGNVH